MAHVNGYYWKVHSLLVVFQVKPKLQYPVSLLRWELLFSCLHYSISVLVIIRRVYSDEGIYVLIKG